MINTKDFIIAVQVWVKHWLNIFPQKRKGQTQYLRHLSCNMAQQNAQ